MHSGKRPPTRVREFKRINVKAFVVDRIVVDDDDNDDDYTIVTRGSELNITVCFGAIYKD